MEKKNNPTVHIYFVIIERPLVVEVTYCVCELLCSNASLAAAWLLPGCSGPLVYFQSK